MLWWAPASMPRLCLSHSPTAVATPCIPLHNPTRFWLGDSPDCPLPPCLRCVYHTPHLALLLVSTISQRINPKTSLTATRCLRHRSMATTTKRSPPPNLPITRAMCSPFCPTLRILGIQLGPQGSASSIHRSLVEHWCSRRASVSCTWSNTARSSTGALV